MARSLPPDQAQVLQALRSDEEKRVSDLADHLHLDQAQVSAAVVTFEQEGWVEIRTEEIEEWSVDPDLPRLADFVAPRTAIARALVTNGGRGAIPQVSQWTGLDPKEVGQAIRPFTASGLGKKEGGDLVVDEGALAALVADDASGPPPSDPATRQTWLATNLATWVGPEEAVIRNLASTGPRSRTALREDGFDVGTASTLAPLALPKNGFQVKVRRARYARLTAEGARLQSEGVEARREVNQLTPELLANGEWRSVTFRPYDIDLATERRWLGKRHPLQQVIARTRQAFLEMGFEEVVSPHVESGFWNFDALFQPQDHPAREMQDTFYMKNPGSSPLPDPAMVGRVRSTHEDGGETGSVGWRYRWDASKAEQNVLRTHTTATTIRELAKNPRGPRKVFSIGRVYRRETIDYKHLPIFFQVDGIIIDEHASFSSLLGTLAAFYERMGFEKFYFRPGFFPYTEPSVEVFIWHEEKQDWFEMGGSGIFRPEVTQPLGCEHPVLAWGLGLDRLAMLLFDRADIRDLYLADLEWLRTEPRCR
ncbi:MAG: phenylalanine--tRNA ligase subunit alpha [Candidatus Eisenbacteria bacterium]|uniref:phenylalanine--tRNA ligase n=1 Tax=Eiseniibacteriota bacterium TaxID=2212470 RepID=A0A956LX88_UNCEI|nr:phenylalanine--tRNA ligase subunit alpha [Candidatus Eisenbacteria bacterium]